MTDNRLILHDECALDVARKHESMAKHKRALSIYAMAIGVTICLVLIGVYLIGKLYYDDELLKYKITILTAEIVELTAENEEYKKLLDELAAKNKLLLDRLANISEEYEMMLAEKQEIIEELQQETVDRTLLQQKIIELENKSDPSNTVINYTLFSTVTLNNYTVVTGAIFKTSDDTQPSNQFCYASRATNVTSMNTSFYFGLKDASAAQPTYVSTSLAAQAGYSIQEYNQLKKACRWLY